VNFSSAIGVGLDISADSEDMPDLSTLSVPTNGGTVAAVVSSSPGLGQGKCKRRLLILRNFPSVCAVIRPRMRATRSNATEKGARPNGYVLMALYVGCVLKTYLVPSVLCFPRPCGPILELRLLRFICQLFTAGQTWSERWKIILIVNQICIRSMGSISMVPELYV
jgi:hypothetical protein